MHTTEQMPSLSRASSPLQWKPHPLNNRFHSLLPWFLGDAIVNVPSPGNVDITNMAMGPLPVISLNPRIALEPVSSLFPKAYYQGDIKQRPLSTS